MEARHGNTLTESSSDDAVRTEVTERLVDDLKAVIQRAQEKAVPKLEKLAGPWIALPRRHEDFLRFHVQKTEAHGAMAHDAFQVPDAAAAAVAFLGVERDHHVARLPNSVVVRMAAESDTVAQVPDANQLDRKN